MVLSLSCVLTVTSVTVSLPQLRTNLGSRAACCGCRRSNALRASANIPGDEEEVKIPAPKTYEMCTLDENNEIETCEVFESEDLIELLGLEEAARVMNDPSGSDVLFKLRRSEDTDALEVASGRQPVEAAGGESDEYSPVFTMADWQMCLDDDTCDVPDDVLLRGFGPDKLAVILRRQAELEEKQAELEETASEEEEEVEASAGTAATESMSAEERETERAIAAASRFHVHFGAGRLGMGLVVPAISASGIAFAVVQRPKPKWQRLFAKGQAAREEEEGEGTANGLKISSNDEVVVHNVKLISESDTPEYMPPKSLVFGSSPEALEEVVERATSFSCSLGSAMSKVIQPLLSTLPLVPREEQPLLFACENDHGAVATLKKQLEGRVFVVDCMVDRVCTGREIDEDGVHVQAEPWRGSIVVLEPNLTSRVPFCSTVATVPSSAREAAYLSDRKLSLVNGMHTVLAFMTLDAQYETPMPGEEREYVLDKYDRMNRAEQRMCEAWRAARVAQLVDEFPSASIATWHEKETREEAWELLLQFADYTLTERFSKVDDVVSRVLGGGVANRWLTRLRPTDTWLAKRKVQGDGREGGATAAGAAGGGASEHSHAGDETRQLLFYAMRRDRERAIERGGGVDGIDAIEAPVETPEEAEAFVAECLEALTSRSRRFCSKELEITHKSLVKEQRKAGGKKLAPRVQSAIQRAYELDAARSTAAGQVAAAGRAGGAPKSVWEGVTFDYVEKD